jgi:acetamidase/formamidase
MGSALDINWLTPDLLRRIPAAPYQAVTWSLDTVSRVARLEGSMGRLGNLTVPLRPHVGMIAVAPAGNATFPAGEEGAHGGNLDYSALGAGSTLYLPVNHAGALLSVGGDVHAAQGDGELTRNGLEANADIDYVVEVREGGNLPWVRAEDASHLMAFGSSEDLNVALRLALSHLVEWLEAEYSLSHREIAVLLGSAAELDIANVFGQQRTIVAKVAKRFLPPPEPAMRR